MKFLGSGKVKDVYDAGDDMLLFAFSDRVSAFDVKFTDTIPRKGEMLCSFAQYWFEQIPGANHFVRRISSDTILVRKLDMIPMECVVRGYLYGSLMDRFQAGSVTLPAGSGTNLASPLSEPFFDPTTKSEHDSPLNKESAVYGGLVTYDTFDELQKRSIAIYRIMSHICKRAGFILADIKLEFGILDGHIMLADSIGPDEYRLWPAASYRPGAIQEAHDKQVLRDWLVKYGWAKRFDKDREAGRIPQAPPIPPEISRMLTDRYVSSYHALAGISR